METAAPRALRAVVVGVFVAATAGAGLVDLVAPAPARVVLGEAGEALARAEAAATFADAGVIRVFERRVKERSRVARAVVTPWGAFLYGLFDYAGDDVVTGREGRLFLKSRLDLDARDPAALGARAGVSAALVARRLAARGPRVTFVPVPEAHLVDADLLRRPTRGDQRAALRALVAAARARGLRVVDLEPPLAAARARGEEVFYRTDTHWNFRGAALAAEAVAEALGRRVAPESRRTTLRPAKTGVDFGDLLRAAGLDTHRLEYEPLSRALASLRRGPATIDVPEVVDRAGSPVSPPDRATASDLTFVGSSFSAIFGTAGLPAFVAHAIDAPVRAYTWLGLGAFEILRRAEELERGRADVKDLVWEAPSTLLLDAALARDFLGEWLAGARTDAATPLRDAKGGSLLEPPVASHGFVSVGVLSAKVFHDGDGVVAFRLRGGAKTALAEPRPGAEGLRARDVPAEEVVVLPVVEAGPTSGGRLVVEGPPRDADAFELVVDVDLAPEAAVVARLAKPVAVAGGWEQVATFPGEGADAGQFSEVDARFAYFVRGAEARPIDVDVRVLGDAGVEPLRREIRGGAVDARLFVNPAPLGGRVRSVVVSGAGPPPTRALAEVALRPLKKPAR